MGKSGKEHKAKFDHRNTKRDQKHSARFTHQQPQAKKKAA